ncbi:MAG: ABC transporter permease [Chloroflexi bacterium]|nr:ABC transporter permease [Chloroflexota bacterium]
MQPLIQLTIANIRSFVRDRAALFWTLAFPLIFILMFGAIFTGGGSSTRTFAWVDDDGSGASAELRAAFAALDGVELTDTAEEDALASMRAGDLNAVLVVPEGYGEAIAAAAQAPGPPVAITVYTDPTQQQETADTFRFVDTVLGQVNLAIAGRGPAVIPEPRAVQTESLTFISYLVPSILGMALMQLGVFAAIPLVADREKLILKRLSATPLRRWQLVGSNVLMRLLIALGQTVIIVAVGALAFDVQVSGNLLLVGALVVMGSVSFIALGYVIAAFARTEDAANGMTSVVQFPLMFLSGTFFPIDSMPDLLKGVARVLPLTYLSDALRQTMVGGTPFAPLWLCFAVLAGFLVVCFAISARFFRWT